MIDDKTFAVLSVSYKNGELNKMDELRKHYEERGGEVEKDGFVVDTCNRFEHYFVAEDLTEASKYIGKAAREIGTQHTIALYDKMAVKHGMKVASGLDSAALGDDEILSQFKDSYHSYNVEDDFLQSFFESTVQTAKKVRKETDITKGTVSIVQAAINEADSYVEDFPNKNIAIIGAGEVGQDLIKSLEPRTKGEIYLVNRTFEKADRVIEYNDYDAEAYDFSDLESVLWNSHVVFSATSSTEPVIDQSITPNLNCLFVDLANPRDIDLPDKFEVLDLDYINSVVSKNQENKNEAASKADLIIDRSYKHFKNKVQREKSSDIVKDFKKEVDAHKEENLSIAESRFYHQDMKTAEMLEEFADGLANDIMGDIVERLHQIAVEEDEDSLETAKKLLTGENP